MVADAWGREERGEWGVNVYGHIASFGDEERVLKSDNDDGCTTQLCTFKGEMYHMWNISQYSD